MDPHPLTELQTLLAGLYDDVNARRRVATEAGLPVDRSRVSHRERGRIGIASSRPPRTTTAWPKFITMRTATSISATSGRWQRSTASPPKNSRPRKQAATGRRGAFSAAASSATRHAMAASTLRVHRSATSGETADRDTPAGADPEAHREEAFRECASVLLVLTLQRQTCKARAPTMAACAEIKPIVPVRFAPGIALPLILGQRTVLDFSGPLDKALAGLRRHLDDLVLPAGQVAELELSVCPATPTPNWRGARQHLAHCPRRRAVRGGTHRPTCSQHTTRRPQTHAAEKRTEAALNARPAGAPYGRPRPKQVHQPAAARRPGLFSGPPHRKPSQSPSFPTATPPAAC